VCGWEGGGGVESCWRPYSAGVHHSVSDQIFKDRDNVKTRCLEGVKIIGNSPIKLALKIKKK
jgi:hypothetical protein